MKRPLEYLAKGLGMSPTALWILLLAALLVWLALGAPIPQVGSAGRLQHLHDAKPAQIAPAASEAKSADKSRP